MHVDLVSIEHIVAIAGGIIVGVVAFYALYKDWNVAGTENTVFKIMLFLLGFGAIIAILAGAGILGNFPPGEQRDQSEERLDSAGSQAPASLDDVSYRASGSSASSRSDRCSGGAVQAPLALADHAARAAVNTDN